jgi:hypothetical protein
VNNDASFGLTGLLETMIINLRLPLHSETLPLDLSESLTDNRLLPWGNLPLDLSESLTDNRLLPWENLPLDLSESLTDNRPLLWESPPLDLSESLTDNLLHPLLSESMPLELYLPFPLASLAIDFLLLSKKTYDLRFALSGYSAVMLLVQ